MSQSSEKVSRSVITLAVDACPPSQEEKESQQNDGQNHCQSDQPLRESDTWTCADDVSEAGSEVGAGTFASPGRPTPSLLMSGSCQTTSCSCLRGLFISFESTCISCPHSMAAHAPNHSPSPFGIGTPYISNRDSSVKAAIKLLIEKRVIVLRAPPFTGKSTLLSLIGAEILRNHQGLEPVMIFWERRSAEEISKKPYYDLLDEKLELARARNDKLRLKQNFTSSYISSLFRRLNGITAQWTWLAKGNKNASRDPVYLVDDAVNTYSEKLMWEKLFKNPDHTGKALFVLVCVHGSADGTIEWGFDLSQATTIPLHQRIELHPNAPGQLCLLLTPQEIEEVVKIWAAGRVHPFQIGPDVIEYLEFETQGHAGMLQMVLRHLSNIADGDQIDRARQSAMQWDGALCRWYMHENKDFLNSLSYSRGLWTEHYERDIDKRLESEKREKSHYQHLTFSDIEEGLKKVASQLGGYHADRPDPVLDFCHTIGLVHTELKDSKTSYMFASRLHQRFAYSRLFCVPGPDAAADRRSLEEVCITTLTKLDPSTLQLQREGSTDQCIIPEAAFQNEMYCCLFKKLPGCLIWPEHSHDAKERIGFLMPDKKWAIGLLQNGTDGQILEYARRFDRSGKYQKWGIIQEYVVINFCYTMMHQDLRDTGFKDNPELCSRTLQVVFQPEEDLMEIYGADHHLRASFHLREG